ncbi:MAG TPA: hypothetical protein VJR05_03340 [Acidimicrobiia bacterium]|nr:hypothetical protein [Acidimicrobiia bacterium]
MRRITIVLLTTLSAALIGLPAAGTVHEITGTFCAGEHGNHSPPGLSGGSRADNLAK